MLDQVSKDRNLSCTITAENRSVSRIKLLDSKCNRNLRGWEEQRTLLGA